jgi:hypothetical protein
MTRTPRMLQSERVASQQPNWAIRFISASLLEN